MCPTRGCPPITPVHHVQISFTGVHRRDGYRHLSGLRRNRVPCSQIRAVTKDRCVIDVTVGSGMEGHETFSPPRNHRRGYIGCSRTNREGSAVIDRHPNRIVVAPVPHLKEIATTVTVAVSGFGTVVSRYEGAATHLLLRVIT
jgi:hypothetical protein